MSMFLNIYSTIKVFKLINEDEKERHQEEIETLEVDNMMYREEIKTSRKRISEFEAIINELDSNIKSFPDNNEKKIEEWLEQFRREYSE